MKEVNSEAYTYWKDGYFYFDELALADIMEGVLIPDIQVVLLI